jgi:hypothetical protein
VLGLAAMLYLTRSVMKAAIRDNLLTIGLSSVVLCLGGAFVVLGSIGNKIAPSLAYLFLAAALLGFWVLRSRPLMAEAGFSVLSRGGGDGKVKAST